MKKQAIQFDYQVLKFRGECGSSITERPVHTQPAALDNSVIMFAGGSRL
jgi:hypothetical protein